MKIAPDWIRTNRSDNRSEVASARWKRESNWQIAKQFKKLS